MLSLCDVSFSCSIIIKKTIQICAHHMLYMDTVVSIIVSALFYLNPVVGIESMKLACNTNVFIPILGFGSILEKYIIIQ